MPPYGRRMDFGRISDMEAADARSALIALMAEQPLVTTPSLRTIAKYCHISCQTLLRRFGTKPVLHRRVLAVFAVTWCHWLEQDLMPRGEFQQAHMRLRLAFAELARHDPELAEVMEEVMTRERWLIGRKLPGAVPRPPDDLMVATIHALAVELWAQRCRLVSPLSDEEARARLRDYMEHLRWSDGTPVVDGAHARLIT